MGPSGLEPTLQPGHGRRRRERPDHPVVGTRRTAVGDDRHPQRITPAPTERCVDDAVRCLGDAPHHRVVDAGGAVVGELADQVVGGVVVSARRRAGPSCRRRAGARCPGASGRRRPRCRGTGRAARWPACRSCCPAPGCTTSPGGLSTTMTCSSSWTTPNSTVGSGPGNSVTGNRAGSTATSWPSTSRTLPDGAGAPSTVTPPASIVRSCVGPTDVADQRDDAIEALPVERRRDLFDDQAGRDRGASVMPAPPSAAACREHGVRTRTALRISRPRRR